MWIEECGSAGESLEEVRARVRPLLARLIAERIREGIKTGRFVVVDGVVRLVLTETEDHAILPMDELTARKAFLLDSTARSGPQSS